jgi:hypothetical protein
MSNLELILNVLAEATTTQLHTVRDSNGFPELKRDANDGGGVAGNARKEIDQKSGKPLVNGVKHRGLGKPKGGSSPRMK